MKRKLAIALFSAILALNSCSKERINGNGPITTETRNVSSFTAILSGGSTDVFVTQGSTFKVEVKGYSNLLPYYETELVNNTLRLGYKSDVNVKNDNTQVYITMPVLNDVNIAGSGDFKTTGNFTGNTSFKLNTSGSGDIHIEGGSAQNFYSNIAGSGNIYALGMVADNVETVTSGSGNTEVTANNQLKVVINGSGNVYYLGNPTITANITGSGAVMHK